MQNKPNFRKSQMNVSIFLQMAYENKSNWTLGESKPNSNPILVDSCWSLSRIRCGAGMTMLEDNA
jgi:hypothetical protein